MSVAENAIQEATGLLLGVVSLSVILAVTINLSPATNESYLPQDKSLATSNTSVSTVKILAGSQVEGGPFTFAHVLLAPFVDDRMDTQQYTIYIDNQPVSYHTTQDGAEGLELLSPVERYVEIETSLGAIFSGDPNYGLAAGNGLEMRGDSISVKERVSFH